MAYDANGQWITETSDRRHATDADRVEASIPIIGSISGASDRVQRDYDQQQSDANRGYWDSLLAPSADALTPQYDWQSGGRDAQMAALDQLQQWGRGGLTASDRGMLESTRRRDEQAAASQRSALMQQAQARGMGGSGLDYATQMQSNQAGQAMASDAESQMLQAAQQRALAAVQAQGQLGSQMRGQDFDQTTRTAESRTDATQQAYEDAANRAAGATGQYSTDVGSAQARAQRRQQTDHDTSSLLGSLIQAIAS